MGQKMKYVKYLRYVIRHKWFVFVECCRLGIPWLGVVHDISKFRLDEFVPYANHFYGNGGNIKKGRDETGYYKPHDTGNEKFEMAWLLHQKRNKHHWQWWVSPCDREEVKVLDMPLKYRKEMLADWRGAGKAQGTPDTLAWWNKNKSKIKLHDNTARWVERNL